ncbi:MAG: hypothetical protein KatS3mg113_0596 [Planctomycetaceae bacterium]|nr:MAG: hypothetical protein KatS3mg113_0596 [Planctomycetaceae bacterium]
MSTVIPLTRVMPEVSVPFIDLVPQFESIRHEIMSAVERVFASQRFILGDEVAALEEEIARYCGTRYAIACNSGTDALLLALQALNIGRGDEVITTPFSFFATASAICRVGATPVFVDIDSETFLLDVEAVERAITPRTRAIIPVHLYGQCVPMQPLRHLAEKHGLAVVEDACQAIGAEEQGIRAGSLGDVGCFSFFPTKNLGGAGDGGIMTTNDEQLARRLKRLRVHGDVGVYDHLEIGINSRLDAVQAAVLRVKLKYLDTWTMARQTHAARYAQLFHQCELAQLLKLPTVRPGCRHVFNQFCIRTPEGWRDALLQHLRSRGVGCAVYYPKPLHLQACFAALGYQPGDLPCAEQASRTALALPVYPELPAHHQDRVVAELAAFCAQQRSSLGASQRRAA